jgi:ABC-2 type transport system permease protein
MASNAIRLIARKNGIELRRDHRLIGAIILVALLALAALAATYVRSVNYQRDRAAATAMERQSWVSQGSRDPHSAAHFAQWAFQPIDAPALLDPGTLPHSGSAIWMEAHARNPAAFRPAEDQTGALQIGEFSVAWVLQTIAPLVLFVLAAGTIARERERGTLRLLVASDVGGRTLVRAKVQGIVRVAALLVLPLLMVAAAAVLLAPNPPHADHIWRTLCWSAAHAGFLLIAVFIGVAVSARTRATSAALVVLIAGWIIAVPLAPKAAASFAEALHPTPSGERFWAAIQSDIRDGFEGSGSSEQREAAFEAQLLARYGVTELEALPISYRGARLDYNERFGNRVFAHHHRELEKTAERQRNVMRAFSVLTPVIAMQNVSAALAGTDNAHAHHFARQAETERQRVVNALNRDLIFNSAGNPNYTADQRLWRQFGVFEPASLPLAAALRTVWPDLLILAVWLALGWWLLLRSDRALRRDFVQ